MTDHGLLLWTMVASAVSALGTVAAALIAWRAATAWRDGLRQQRADELVAALNDCAAAIGRTIARKVKAQQHAPGGLGVDQSWSSWARVRTAYAVAVRYYPDLPENFPEQGEALLRRMEAFTQADADPSAGDEVNNAFGVFQRSAASILR